VLLFIPVAMIFYRVFAEGIGNAWASITSPEGVHAFWLTIEVVAIAVPLNTAFGVLCALVLVRQRFRGRELLNSAIDLRSPSRRSSSGCR